MVPSHPWMNPPSPQAGHCHSMYSLVLPEGSVDISTAWAAAGTAAAADICPFDIVDFDARHPGNDRSKETGEFEGPAGISASWPFYIEVQCLISVTNV